METVFVREVYRAVKKIPRGRVSTYGLIALAAGRPKASRAVGNVLRKNPYLPAVPCHRVVRSDGRVGGYAQGGRAKVKLLRRENVIIRRGRIVDFKKALFNNF